MITSANDDPGNDYTIAAVDRAIQLLELLGKIGPASLAQLAKEAGCTRTAAFRLLRTLSARGFAVQDGPRGNWRLGARLIALREAATAQGALASTAAPVLQQLARETGEPTYLLVRDDREAEIAAIHNEKSNVRPLGHVGMRRPLAAGAGRLLLAFAPDVVQAQVLAQPVPRYTPLTITDPHRIAVELGRIRTRGWLMTDGESITGTMSISAAIRDAAGRVGATVTIFGPTIRLRGRRGRELVPAVIKAAADISHLLGAPAGPRPGAFEQ